MEAGQILHGRYELLEFIGGGGMGQVWKARDLTEPGYVAIKGMKHEVTAEPGRRRRLELEASTLARLRHDRIVNILGEFEEDGELYLVMQLIQGPNLREATESGQLSDAAKVSILIDVLEALVYLHDEAEVVHRDLKPANVLLDQEQRAYVTDFGLARGPDALATRSVESLASFAFASPEVRAGRPATQRSDVWSFGATALWLFTERLYDAGVPEGDFAGALTEDIRAALSSRRPSAYDLLESLRRAEREGISGPVHAAQHDGLTRAIPVGAVTAGSGAAAPGDANQAPARRRNWLPLVLSLVVLAAIIALAVSLLRPGPETAAAPTTPPVTDTTPSPTKEPSPAPTSTPTPTFTTPSPTPTPSTALPPSGPTWYYLADMSPVGSEIEGRPGRCTGGCTGFSSQPGTIEGEIYPQSYVMRMDSDGKRSVSTWNAYTKCTTFEATIGLDDSSASVKTRFLLEREGGVTEDLGILPTGEGQKVTVDLTGVFRFTLVSHLTEASKQTTQKAVWGDARMLCAPLPTQQP